MMCAHEMRFILILLLLLLLTITASHATNVQRRQSSDCNDESDDETEKHRPWRFEKPAVARSPHKRNDGGISSVRYQSNQQPHSIVINSKNPFGEIGKSLRMTPQSSATSTTLDNPESRLAIPSSLPQADLTAIQEQQQNHQDEFEAFRDENAAQYDATTTATISRTRQRQRQVNQMQTMGILMAGLVVAIGSSAMTLVLTTTTALVASSPVSQFKVLPSTLAAFPWIWSLRNRPMIGGIMLELMTMAQLVAQHPAWYHAQVKVVVSFGLKMLQQFVIWEFWRQVWRASGRLFLNQLLLYSRHHDDSWMSLLPVWMQSCVDFGDATLRRGIKKWLQKNVEKIVETNAISWFVWIKDMVTFSS